MNDVRAEQVNSLIMLNKQGLGIPIIFIHPAGGQIHWFRNIAKHMKGKRACYAFMSTGLLVDNYGYTTLKEIAEAYVDQLTRRLTGPYIIAGYSFGCEVAFEMTQLLQQSNVEVPLLLLLDSQVLLYNAKHLLFEFLTQVLSKEFSIQLPVGINVSELTEKPLEEIISWLYSNILLVQRDKNQANLYLRSIRAYLFNMLAKSHNKKEGKVKKIVLYRASNCELYNFLRQATKEDWHLHGEDIVEQVVPGDHFTMLEGESSSLINQKLELELEKL